MALNQTYTTIQGRLASDPNHKLTSSDVDVTRFRMASNERRYDRQTDQWVNGDQLFIDVTCWRRLAFNVKACLTKGDPVVVYGRLYTSEYEVDGKRRYETRLEAHSVGPDLGWISVAMRRRQRSDADGAQAATNEQTGTTEQDESTATATGDLRGAQAAADLPEPIDELARRLLEEPPEGTDGLGREVAEREEALMAGV